MSNLQAIERPRHWMSCDCEGGSVLVKLNDEFGDTAWTRCPRCRGAGEIYFGPDNEPEEFADRDNE